MKNNSCDNGLVSLIKKFIQYINIFDIPRLTREISCDVKHIKEKYDETMHAIEKYKLELEKERETRTMEKNLFLSVLDHLDDMVWAKDLDGKYIVANKSFREKFCYGISWNDLQWKTDQQLALKFKRLVGEENHTFGELCANSDTVIHKTQLPQEFLEYGNINGKLMKLIVNKSPVFDKSGKFYATCGSGKNVTKWHNDVEKAIADIKSECSYFQYEYAEKILNELNKFRLKENDHAKQ